MANYHISRQDMPPPGGYPAIITRQRLPPPRATGATLFLAASAVIIFGFYKVIEGNQERRTLKEEKRAIRATLIPFLQAEKDLVYLQKKAELDEEDAKLFPKTKGDWEAQFKVYNGGRWVADPRIR